MAVPAYRLVVVAVDPSLEDRWVAAVAGLSAVD